jgi:hypothetical protein
MRNLPIKRRTEKRRSKMRSLLVAICLSLVSLVPAEAQVSVQIGGPAVEIGVNVAAYPNLVPVPGYPVYYDPQMDANYFFYDGLYWVYAGDSWYASSWYNGPWQLVAPESVPLFVLRVPVRYYRRPPVYFRGWQADAPPRWGEHWGPTWQARHNNWDHWDHAAVPRPAPLPVYQREYSGARYPHAVEQQRALRTQNYHYEPHEAVAQQHYQQAPKPPPGHAEPPPRPPPGHAEPPPRPPPGHAEPPPRPPPGHAEPPPRPPPGHAEPPPRPPPGHSEPPPKAQPGHPPEQEPHHAPPPPKGEEPKGEEQHH